jgi:hypothetical protein
MWGAITPFALLKYAPVFILALVSETRWSSDGFIRNTHGPAALEPITISLLVRLLKSTESLESWLCTCTRNRLTELFRNQ